MLALPWGHLVQCTALTGCPLLLGKINKMAECIRMDIQCAQICRLAASYMAQNSEYANDICQLCADICQKCADECAKHDADHCQACAQACQQCANACASIAA
nr:four-helix bundle copper-binding protein [uncultured Halomonas sp.]